MARASQAPSMLKLKDTALIRPVQTSTTHSVNHSRAVSPFSRKPSPPRSATPVPTTSGLSFPKNVTDSLQRTNELLNQEIQKLRAQVDGLRHRCEIQEFELQKSSEKAQEAMALAAEEAAKSKVAKEIIKPLTTQVTDMSERLLHGVYENDQIRPTYPPNGIEPHALYHSSLNEGNQLNNDATSGPANPSSINSLVINGLSAQNHSPSGFHETNELGTHLNNHRVANSNQEGEYLNSERGSNSVAEMSVSGRREDLESRVEPCLNGENASNSRSPTSNNQVEAEWIEQYEAGVYITLVALRDGTRDLKRVRFSRRRFGEYQAEAWWSENRAKVYEKYNVRGSDRASAAAAGTQSVRRFDEELTPSEA